MTDLDTMKADMAVLDEIITIFRRTYYGLGDNCFADALSRVHSRLAKTLPAEGVAVKPLEWADPSKASNGCYVANTFFGDYYAAQQDGLWYSGHEDVSFDWCCDYETNTLEDAKAAAQADYETRILSCLTHDYLSARLADAEQPAVAGDGGLREALKNLEEWASRQECEHEETHRGGAIWEFCDGCGAKWADDEGGRPPYEVPQPIAAARAALSTSVPAGVDGR